MEKQFTKFKALVPANFKGLMIQYWMSDEGISRNKAIDYYLDSDFENLNKRIANTVQEFKPDLGYTNKDRNGRLCFEAEDNNFVIPVEILEKAEALA
jgi:hypothetical protein